MPLPDDAPKAAPLPGADRRTRATRHGAEQTADQRLVRSLFDNTRSTLVIGVLVACVVCFAVWRSTGNSDMVGWLTLIVVVTLARLALLGTFRRHLARHRASVTGLAYAVTAAVAGVAWALMVVFDDASYAVGARLMILVTLIGMPVASLSSNAVYLPVFYAFAVPIFISLYYWAWWSIPGMAFEFTLLATSYVALVSIMANRYHQNLRRGLLRDIENEALLHEVNSMNDELQRMAYQDPLTGLSNRRSFEETTTRLLERRRRTDQLALMLIDMDKFKWINDNLGHAAGDATLVELSRRIEENSRISEVVAQAQIGAARIGGDEFIVVYRLGADVAIEPIAGRILDALSLPMEFEGERYSPGVSIGIAIAPRHADELDGLLRAADDAMYRAKSAGGGRFVIADDRAAQGSGEDAETLAPGAAG